MKVAPRILPIIVFAQFCGTSLWFAGNGVLNDLTVAFNLSQGIVGPLTSAVQLGFISGTLVFALATISDRYKPSAVFVICAFLGSIFNLGVIWQGNTFFSLLTFRFMTGFFLAGIYPVGMKIAADYYNKGLGLSLGYLVGALVVGTAFPHLLKDMAGSLPWRSVIIATSILAFSGGIILWLFVPDGPFRKPGKGMDIFAFASVFKKRDFRLSAFGYFGHMWELYTFWAFVPILLSIHWNMGSGPSISFWSFVIIAVGGPACVTGGYLSRKIGPGKTALIALIVSGFCCLLSPFMLIPGVSDVAFILYLLIWGTSVIADSPMLSTLVAYNADDQIKGTALTIVNSMGFSITIFSILLVNYAIQFIPVQYGFLLLAPGPILGAIALKRSAGV